MNHYVLLKLIQCCKSTIPPYRKKEWPDYGIFKKNFLLEYGWFTMYNVLVSAVQQSESVIHIHVSTLF